LADFHWWFCADGKKAKRQIPELIIYSIQASTKQDTIMAASKRILVTGGAGFIGWRCCEQLSADGHSVAVLDNLSVGLPMQTDSSYETVEGDVRDADKAIALAQRFKPDTIIHLAAVHHIPTCEKKRAYALDANVIGTEIMLEAAEKSGAETFVLASSGAVYDWKDGPLNESATPLWPCDNYALSKLTNEGQLRFWSERTGASARVCRIFNTIGHDDPNAHLIPDILNQLFRADGKATIALGNLAPRRDYIHAKDTACGVAAVAAAASADKFDIFNVGSGKDASVEELVRMIGAAMSVEIDIVQDQSRVRRVDRMSQLADVSKISQQLGWSAKISLKEAVADIVANFPFQAAA
jgi:UDP-glucose 4-epimerase